VVALIDALSAKVSGETMVGQYQCDIGHAPIRHRIKQICFSAIYYEKNSSSSGGAEIAPGKLKQILLSKRPYTVLICQSAPGGRVSYARSVCQVLQGACYIRTKTRPVNYRFGTKLSL
jgi:hypothetical protein